MHLNSFSKSIRALMELLYAGSLAMSLQAQTFNEVEPNNSLSMANTVSDTTTKITGMMSPTTDLDFFKINVPAGRRVTVSMTGPTGSDYDLHLLNSAGTVLKRSEGSTSTERITYTNTGTATAMYYLKNFRYSGSSSTNTYNLTIDRITGNPTLLTVSINPTTATMNTGATQQFTASVTGSSNTAVTWSVVQGSPGSGSITPSGLFTAVTAGTCTVKAISVADTTKVAEATVTIISTYSLTTSVSPIGGGTITRSPHATSYASGTLVTLTATPATNYTFSGWSGSVMGSSRTVQITMSSNKVVRASFKTSSPNCGTPPFYPAPWNDGGTVQRNNNCYNYSNNVKTNTFAQPGVYCGDEVLSVNCSDVIAAAKCDGLVPTTKDAVLPAGMTRIALVVDDGFDFHWYRQDSDGMWSHKPGSTKARNTDESGQPISDPETCDRGGYTSFCLYFQICSGVEQFGGHSTIR